MTKNGTPTPVYLDPGMHPGLEVKGLSKYHDWAKKIIQNGKSHFPHKSAINTKYIPMSLNWKEDAQLTYTVRYFNKNRYVYSDVDISKYKILFKRPCYIRMIYIL